MSDPSISQGNDPKTLMLLGAGAAFLIVTWIIILTIYSSSDETLIDSAPNDFSSSSSSDPQMNHSAIVDDANESESKASSNLLTFDDLLTGHDASDPIPISSNADLLEPEINEDALSQTYTESKTALLTTEQESVKYPLDESPIEASGVRDQGPRVSWDQVIDSKTWQAVDLAPNLNRTLALMGKGNYQLIASADRQFRFRSGSRVGISGAVDDPRGFPLSTDLEFKAIGEGFQVLSFRLEKEE